MADPRTRRWRVVSAPLYEGSDTMGWMVVQGRKKRGDWFADEAQARRAMDRRQKASEHPPELVIVIKGGMVEEVYGYGLPANIGIVFADCDGDGDWGLQIHRSPKAPHRRPPKPLTIRCDLDDGQVQPMSQPSEILEGTPDDED